MTAASDGTGSVDRRTLLRLAGLTAGASVVAAAAVPQAATAAGGVFQHGVASWVQGWSVARGSSKIKKESAPS